MLSASVAPLAFAGAGPVRSYQSSSVLVPQSASVITKWADHGSGSAHDVIVYSTVVPEGYVAVADYAQVGYGDAGTFTNWQRPYGPPVALRQAGAGATLLAKP
eukprot:3592083-Prymnesium_polylepis.1